ncbi:MAG: S1C family serine protease [Nitrospinota bacterium]
MNKKIVVAKIALIVIFTSMFSTGDLALGASSEADTRAIQNSVVKIVATYNNASYYQPWQFKPISTGVGSGFIISKNRVLTNAHVVSNATYISIERANDARKYKAEIEFIGTQSDLATLKILDPTFPKVKPLAFRKLPKLLDTVFAIGFPAGGERVSFTRGVVSRIEMTKYAHSNERLLAVQIDAAINAGNSGGPVLLDGKVIGVAMQGLRSRENIGYIIPTPVIKSFLTDIKDGHVDGIPSAGIIVQKGESQTLKEAFKAKPTDRGLFVNRVIYGSAAYGVLAEKDIITAIDDAKISDDGLFEFSDQLRIDINYLINQKQVGDEVKYSIIRDGKALTKRVKLKVANKIVPRELDNKPSYLIFGGIVFTKLTENLLADRGYSWRKDPGSKFIYHLYNSFPSPSRKELVVIIKTLAHNVNIGYHDIVYQVVEEVNGKNLKEFRDLPMALGSSADKFSRIVTEDKVVIALDNEAALVADQEILKRYHIKSPFSEDIRAEYIKAFSN